MFFSPKLTLQEFTMQKSRKVYGSCLKPLLLILFIKMSRNYLLFINCIQVQELARPQFSLLVSECGKNLVIFNVDHSSSTHTDNRKNDVLVFGEGSTDELDDIEIKLQDKYFVNTSESRKKICFSLKYHASYIFLYDHGLCLGKI